MRLRVYQQAVDKSSLFISPYRIQIHIGDTAGLACAPRYGCDIPGRIKREGNYIASDELAGTEDPGQGPPRPGHAWPRGSGGVWGGLPRVPQREPEALTESF
jgi:hypothetical protein